MYSARDQSSFAGGSRRPDFLRDSGASCCNPVAPGVTASFALPSSFERKLATNHPRQIETRPLFCRLCGKPLLVDVTSASLSDLRALSANILSSGP